MRNYIIITKEQADSIRGNYGRYSAIDPIQIPDGNYIIPERCINDPDLLEIKQTIIDINGEVQNIIDLPDVGEPCEENRIYHYKDTEKGYNGLVVCRQSHKRTVDAIKDIPNLFTFFRENSDDLNWIPNELVEPGWKRMYNGEQYEFTGAAKTLTIIGQTPDITPAIWTKVQTEEIVDWYQPSGAHDAFRINTLMRYTDGKVYKSLIDYNTYSPVAYPTGWELQPDLV